MYKHFFFGIAKQNIKKNNKTYFPYMAAVVGTIAIYYILYMVANTQGLEAVKGGTRVLAIMKFGTFVLGGFTTIFLFYTNSFLMKNRKKELGLYCVLGMEKRHVARVIIAETIMIGACCIFLGTILGIILTKLGFVLLLKLLQYTTNISVGINAVRIIRAVIFFIIIFFVILLYNIRQLKLVNPIELLRSDKMGEREPKTKLFQVIIGVLTIGIGYGISITLEAPTKAIPLFVFATVLVIIGTYFIFNAGSIAFLKSLKKRKEYFYQTKHFISVSSLIYRMKQNAIGLANICILATAVLILLSTTISIYVGLEDSLHSSFRYDIVLSSDYLADADRQALDEEISKELAKYNLLSAETYEYQYQENIYERAENSFQGNVGSNYSKVADIQLIDAELYEQMSGESLELNENEAYIYIVGGKLEGNSIQIMNHFFHIKGYLSETPLYDKNYKSITDTFVVVVKDRNIVGEIYSSYLKENGEEKEFAYAYNYGINLDESADVQISLTKNLNEIAAKYGVTVGGKEAERDSFVSQNGSILFIGIFLGIIFLMATVMIIYYKQISEGYEDKKRFSIMSKVGVQEKELQQSIKSQVMLVFFFPLIIAGCHLAAVFPCLTKILSLLGLVNDFVIGLSCFGVFLGFTVVYGIVYAITSREYYKIVNND